MSKEDHEKNNELVRTALLEFTSKYPSDEHCLEAIFEMLFPNGEMRCRHCNGKTEKRNFGARFALCLQCRRTSWVTADTPFHGVRKLQARLASIWLMERGLPINIARLQLVLAVPLSTAWAIFHATTNIAAREMLKRFPLIKVGNLAPVIFRRSKESPASEHPRAELDKINETENASGVDISSSHTQIPDSLGSADLQKTDQTDSQTLLESNKTMDTELLNKITVLNLLEAGPTAFDLMVEITGISTPQLSATLTLLEIEGLVTRRSGEVYIRVNSKKTAELSEPLLATLNSSMKLIKTCFQGVSLKYIQNYLAFAWIQYDKQYWKPGNLLRASCGAFKSCLRDLIRNSSPVAVAIYSGS